jgi:hypothetical protein
MPKPLGFFIPLSSSYWIRSIRVSIHCCFCSRAVDRNSTHAAAARHQRSPRADASEDPVHLRMKPSPSKGSKAGAGKKRSRSEAEGSAQVSSSRPNPTKEWKKSKMKTEYLLALVNSGFCGRKRWICGAPPRATRTPWSRTPMRFPCSPGSWSAD